MTYKNMTFPHFSFYIKICQDFVFGYNLVGHENKSISWFLNVPNQMNQNFYIIAPYS